MGPDIQLLSAYAPAVVLHMVRAGAFLSVVPTFGSQASSRMLRLILSIALGVMMWWTTGDLVEAPQHVLELFVVITREVIIGLLGGFAVRATVLVLGVAGELISHEMGFSMARIMNPETGSSSTAMAQLFEIMGFMLIFQLNLHHEMLRVLTRTYELVPVGRPFDYTSAYQRMSTLITDSMQFGLQYAAPAFGVMILLTVVLVVLSRAVPNINLMEFAFGLRILVAFVASIYFLVQGTPFLERVFDHILLEAHGLFEVQ